MIHTIAWRNLWRRKQRVLFTALAMGVGVALSMGSMALQSGIFSEVFDEMVTDTLGHVQIHHPRYPALKHLHDTLPKAQDLMQKTESIKGVRVAAPRLFSVALVGSETQSAGALIIGVDPQREVELSEINLEVTQGRWLKSQQAGELTLGVELAEELGAKLDDQLALVGQDAYGGVAQGLFKVVGIIESGLTELDQAGVWLHLNDAQDLFVLEDQVHELIVVGGQSAQEAMAFGKGQEQVQAFKTLLMSELSSSKLNAVTNTQEINSNEDKPSLLIQTWREARPSVSQLMDTQQASAYIMLIIVLAVAAIGVLNTMLMNIYERSRELGVMLALGVKPSQVRLLIFTESFYLASIAMLIGVLLGGLIDYLLITYGLDFSVDGKGLSYGGVRLSARLYGVFEFSALWLSVIALYVMTLVAAIWPAFKASRIEPIQAIARGEQ